jgi:hypothetical protein
MNISPQLNFMGGMLYRTVEMNSNSNGNNAQDVIENAMEYGWTVIGLKKFGVQ